MKLTKTPFPVVPHQPPPRPTRPQRRIAAINKFWRGFKQQALCGNGANVRAEPFFQYVLAVPSGVGVAGGDPCLLRVAALCAPVVQAAACCRGC